MEKTYWTLEETFEDRFPYRINIVKGYKVLLSLRVQEKWPGQRGNVFCIRESRKIWNDEIDVIENVPVITLKKIGKRLIVVLDRAKNKRCDFLFLKKSYKTKNGDCEQIFWRTATGLKARRPRVIISSRNINELTVIIDKNEKYPWKFTGCEIQKKILPAGDYALIIENEIKAVIERKTFDNMKAEFGQLHVFHQQLSELEAYKNSALVIESNYSDFLNTNKLKFYNPTFCSKIIAEIYSAHPHLTIVFACNRKLSQQWSLRYFQAVADQYHDSPLWKVTDVIENYGTPLNIKGGRYYDIKKRIIEGFPLKFTLTMLYETYPYVTKHTLNKILKDLKIEQKIISHKKGKNSYYEKTI